jgi:hypothetical protein
MEFKKFFENHPLPFGIAMVSLGIGVGMAAEGYRRDIKAPQECVPADAVWQGIARKQNWAPRSECAAYPVSIEITSPGRGTTVGLGSSNRVASRVVIKASRPVPSNSSFGLVVNESNEPNFYVVFPSLDANEQRSNFSTESLYLPFAPKSGATLNVWTVLVEDKQVFGNVYRSLEQITTVSSSVILSKETDWKVVRE